MQSTSQHRIGTCIFERKYVLNMPPVGKRTSWALAAAISVLGILAVVGVAILVVGPDAEVVVPLQPTATHAHLPLSSEHKAPDAPTRMAPAVRNSENAISAGKSDPELARFESLIQEKSPSSLLTAAKMLGECVTNETLARESPGSIAPQPFCQHVDHSYFRERLKWIEVASANRVPGAGTEWVRQGPNGSLVDFYQRPDDPLVAEWKSRALEILNSEAKRGDTEAIGSLLVAYSKLGIGGFNAAKMHAYQRVLWEIQDPANVNEYMKNLEATNRISQQDIDLANDIAAKLLAEIRENKK